MTECNACNNGLLANEIGVGICTPCLSKGHAITNIKINPATIKPEEFKKITYCGSLANATKMYLRDERRLQGENYKAVKDEYIQGSRTWVAFAVAFFLCILLVGLIMFVYFLIVKPEGYLVVTYQYTPPTAEPPTLTETPKYKTCQECAEEVKYEAKICRFCKSSFSKSY